MIDIVTKIVATTFYIQGVNYNYGLFLGNFAASTTFYRVVTLSTIGFFLGFIYLVQLYILPVRLIKIRYPMSIFMGGLLGNVVDRMVDGKTVDFIPFEFLGFVSSYNVADIFMVVAAIMLLYYVFLKDDELWYPKNTRTKFLVMPSDQIRMASYFAITTAFLCTILGIFSITFLQNYVPKYILTSDGAGNNFYFFYGTISVLYVLSSFFFGLLISHKTFGPIYAFKKYLNARTEDTEESKELKFKLRAGDHMVDLEVIAKKVDAALSKKDS